MSKVFEALKQAELAERDRKQSQGAEKLSGNNNRRRTQRAKLEIPLFVYGHTAKDQPFCDEATTTEINAHGGFIHMQIPVQPGQHLLLTNKSNHKIRECLVLSVAARLGGKAEVAFEFLTPAPLFWQGLSQAPIAKRNPKKSA